MARRLPAEIRGVTLHDAEQLAPVLRALAAEPAAAAQLCA